MRTLVGSGCLKIAPETVLDALDISSGEISQKGAGLLCHALLLCVDACNPLGHPTGTEQLCQDVWTHEPSPEL